MDKPKPENKGSLEEFESDSWRSNEKVEAVASARHEPLEHEMPVLNDNDVWFYQTELERLIRRNVPDSMNGRFLAMLRIICAQARRKFNA